MSQTAQTDQPATNAEKDHAQVLGMLNSAEMQKRLDEARARRETVLAERAAAAKDDGPKPAVVQAAIAARMAGKATPLLLVKPSPMPPVSERPPATAPPPKPPLEVVPTAKAPALKAPVLRAPLRPVEGAASRGKPRPLPPTQAKRRSKPSGLVAGLVIGLAAGIGLMLYAGSDAPPSIVATGSTQRTSGLADVEAALPVETSTAARLPEQGPSGADGTLRPRARPGDSMQRGAEGSGAAVRPDIGLIVLPQVADAAPDPAGAAPRAGGLSPAPVGADTGTPAAQHSGLRPQVTLHLPPGLSDGGSDVQTLLRTEWVHLAATRTTGFGVARSEVRFFHEEDAGTARQVAGRLGAEARDFSAYRPAPRPGTLEVWLADRG